MSKNKLLCVAVLLAVGYFTAPTNSTSAPDSSGTDDDALSHLKEELLRAMGQVHHTCYNELMEAKDEIEKVSNQLENEIKKANRRTRSQIEQVNQQTKNEITKQLNNQSEQVTNQIIEARNEIKQVNYQQMKANNQISELKEQYEARFDEIPVGDSPRYPAPSCREIALRKPNSSSGLYWIQQRCSNNPPVQVYCNMEERFKGWVRVANMDMKDPNQQCPPAFQLHTRSEPPQRLCGRSTDGSGCDSVKFPTNGLQYSKVCGRAVGYQYGSPDAFGGPGAISDSIEGAYVDGVSITHGDNPRKHIWTLAAGFVERGCYTTSCPCCSLARQPPSFVGSDYYCESGLDDSSWNAVLYSGDPLWDGEGCEANEAPCCNPTDLPWFCKELPQPTTDDLEVRFCSNQGFVNEDVRVELIELYMQ